MVQKFNAFIETPDLVENNLYKTSAEKDALTKDKDRVATAFLYNFFGMLGMINGVQAAHKPTLMNSFKKDAKLMIGSIGDDNLDISLSVKLAYDAGFFINPATVNEITRFLVKLKAGQITQIDSAIAGRWAAAIKPDFAPHISDPVLRNAWTIYRTDEGKTLDVSWLAVRLKKQLNKNTDTGDFGRYAKRFYGITEIPVTSGIAAPTTVSTAQLVPAPATATPAAPAAPVKLNYYQRQKLKKQQAAAGVTPTPATPAQPAAPKLSYYQRQKLKRDADKAAAAAAAAAAKAAAEAEARAKAEAEAKAKAEAEAARLKQLSAGGIPDWMWEHVDDLLWTSDTFNSYGLAREYKSKNGLNIGAALPPNVEEFIDRLNPLFVAMSMMRPDRGTWIDMLTQMDSKTALIKDAVKQLEKFWTGSGTYMKHFLTKLAEGPAKSSNADDRYVARSLFALTLMWMVDELTTSEWKDLVGKFVKKVPMNQRVWMTMGTQARRPGNEGKIMADVLFADLQDAEYEKLALHLASDITAGTEDTSSKTVSYDSTSSGKLDFAFREIGLKWKHVVNAHWAGGGYTWRKGDIAEMTLMGGATAWAFANSVSAMTDSIKEYIKKDLPAFAETANGKSFVMHMLTETNVGYDGLSYDESYPDKNGPLFKWLHDKYANEVQSNGYTGSRLASDIKLNPTHYRLNLALKRVGVNLDEMIKNRPADLMAIYAVGRTDGTKLSTDQMKIALATDTSNPTRVLTGNNIAHNMAVVLNAFGGNRQELRDKIVSTTTEMYKEDDRLKDSPEFGRLLLDQLPECSSEVTLELLRAAKQKKDKYIMTHEVYKNLYKSTKQTYVDALQAVMQDAIGTDVEDYVNDILEELPQHVKQKLRQNLVGASVIIDDIQSGDIKPFDKIDAARLKQILYYNDINFASLIPDLGKKGKGEKFTEFFIRAKKAAAKAGLHPLKVAANDQETQTRKTLNKMIVDQHHAGRHGDTYPLIHKVFDVNMKWPEFEPFKERNPMDGGVVPAYHGTGGIAAAMILRYGFRVIKSTDASVVGRMLGDGIYFSNKIDKSLQYVSNGGYGRQHGSKGYILLMEVNLGRRNQHYQAAGIGGGDAIRSPEWCVFDPKAQLNIVKAYEVSLESRRTVDRVLAEDTNALMSFASYLKEEAASQIRNVTGFVFRDGEIPIVSPDGDVTYVDFEEALSSGMITADMMEPTAQGPMIVFDNTPEQAYYDMRTARGLIGDDLQLYKLLFIKKMRVEQS